MNIDPKSASYPILGAAVASGVPYWLALHIEEEYDLRGDGFTDQPFYATMDRYHATSGLTREECADRARDCIMRIYVARTDGRIRRREGEALMRLRQKRGLNG